jgi:hypothetical protein
MPRKIKRDEDITSKVDAEDLADLYTAVEKGFEAQRDRSDEIMDNWDLYNCKLSDKQFYNGTSQIATPFTHDAVEARVTRFTNQVFPQSGRYVEVTTGEADPPQATQALIEGYIRRAKLRTRIVPALLRSGDVEGQYTIYVTWEERERHATFRVKKQPMTDGLPNEAVEPVDDVEDEVVVDAGPSVEVISDPDFLMLPATAESVEEALAIGGSVTVLRRWSKGKIKQLMRDKEIPKSAGEDLIEAMNAQRASKDPDVAKQQLDAAGIKERGKIALVYETWTMMEVGKERRLCRAYLGGPERVIGVKQNPFWNDRCPVITAPVTKVAGSSKGKAPVCSVADYQILANDTINEGADTAHFSAMPIVMTDPLANPRAETMVLGLGAVWEVNPNNTEIVTFPQLWKDALDRAGSIRDQIFQTLGVNPAMIAQSTGGAAKKRSQAEIANEQQVDILTTADMVTNLEEGILTPLVQFMAELDHQYRDDNLTIRTYGEMGMRANMEEVEPIQLNKRFEFRWFGVESARNAAQMQQQIAWVNVVKGLPPQMYAGYDLDLSPMIVQGTENVFGPRIAPLIFKKKSMITVDPMVENEMLIEGFPVQVHSADNDQEHMQAHMLVIQAGDPHQKAREHMMMHQQQLQAKAMAQQQQAGGAPGGGPPQPGGGGAPQGPKPGAQPAAPRQMKGPPGLIHPDSMAKAGAPGMPRRN